ncbi:nitrite reductase (NADH) small subunit [Pedococcus dokdonensis]|uniref:Nitrite reductase (NADH) small subunit n=1 Tax=Pedococcus dokdonensis TaxID=443156 RepID=A0A1H0QT07_9MICO|nr:nitrite reductase (NADH) small subunit [Pedococcus dokdonensis]
MASPVAPQLGAPQLVAPQLVALCGLKHVPTRHGAAFTVAGEPLALFRTGDRVWAVEDRNPYTGCGVAGGRLSRVGRTPVVVSPMYHLVFDLRTGACLNAVDLPQLRLRTYPVEVVAEVVHVDVTAVGRTTPVSVPLGALA